MIVEILTASWHRNGVGGEGFHAILFKDISGHVSSPRSVMVASLFERPGCCAVFSVDELAKGNIAFAQGNSWRGDEFADALRPALQHYLERTGTNRVGPFALPQDPR